MLRATQSCIRCGRSTCTCPKRKRIHQGGYAQRYGFSQTHWTKVRLDHLSQEPLCRNCLQAHGITRTAVIVDHIQPHRGRADLFWDQSNYQSLCIKCHAQKTGRGE